MKSRYGKAKKALIFWCLFIGVGAVFGAMAMLIDPSGTTLGMSEMLTFFRKLPFADILFNDFLFSGIALLTVNGITNLTAAVLMLRNKKSGVVCGTVFGVTLMLWICIQFYMFPLNFMSTIYFIFGMCQALTGYAALLFYKQEHFDFNIADYTNIGANKKELTVYFSRMGYTKKVAYELSNKTGASVYEIKATEQTKGTGGFWLCGRYGMHKWAMPIEAVDIDFTQFSHVTICSPVWVFSLAAPVRQFAKSVCGQIKNVDYVIVHHMKSDFLSVADELDALLGVKRNSLTSICCKKGKYIHEHKL